MGLHYSYWSPAAQVPKADTFLLGDGGDMENVHLIGLLQVRAWPLPNNTHTDAERGRP